MSKRYFYIAPDDYDVAAKNGISKLLLYGRVRQLGWDVDRAVTQPVRRTRHKDKWLDIAIQNGIKENTFWMRVDCLKWTKEKAATTKVRNYGNTKYPEELLELAKANGICYSTLTTRINRCGLEPLEAATRPLKKRLLKTDQSLNKQPEQNIQDNNTTRRI